MKFQKFHLNRINYLILILLSIVFLPNVKAIVKPTSNFYINDYATILSYETEEYILKRSAALNNVDGTQIVVVTVPNLEGMTLESYATKLFRQFGIGDKYKNNGLLLLLALEEREFRVEVGYGLEGILPDGKTGRFQDQYIIPYLKDNNWDEGVKNGYDDFYSEIVKLNNLNNGYDAFYKEIGTLNNLNVNYTEPTHIDNSSSRITISRPGYDYGFEVFIFFYLIPIIGAVIGSKIRNLKKNKNLWTIYILLYG